MSTDGRGHGDLDAMARRVIETNPYPTLATLDGDGRPRLSPVYYTPARYRDFYWVSAPSAHHSVNVMVRPDVQGVIFDSSVQVGHAEAVYLSGTARLVEDDELAHVLPEAFRTDGGAEPFAADELRGDADLRLYVMSASGYEVLVRGSDPVHWRGHDTRQPADPLASVSSGRSRPRARR